jgi:hypothetical protein
VADGHKPGNERAGRLLIPRDGLPGLEKDLLGKVLSIMFIAYTVIDVSIYPVDMDVIEPPESFGITAYGSLNQLGFI